MSGLAHFVPNLCFSAWTEHSRAVIPVPVPSFGMETKINVKGPDPTGLKRSAQQRSADSAQGHVRARSALFFL